MLNLHLAHYTNINNISSINDEGLNLSKHIRDKNEKKCMLLGDGRYFFDYNCPHGYKIGRSLSLPIEDRHHDSKFARYSVSLTIHKENSLNLNNPDDRQVIIDYFTEYEVHLRKMDVAPKFKSKDVKIALDHIGRLMKYSNEHYGWTFGFMLNDFFENALGINVEVVLCKFVTNSLNKEGTQQYNVRNGDLITRLNEPDVLTSKELQLNMI